MPGYFNESNQAAGRTVAGSNGGSVPTGYPVWVSAPFFTSYVTTHTAGVAFKNVMSDVGANQPLDDHDVRVIAETKSGTFTYTGTGPYGGFPGLPNSQTDVGGWEDYGSDVRAGDFDTDHDGIADVWERAHGQPVGTANNNVDTDGDGYTELEDYLHWLAAPHASTALNTAVDVDLRAFAKGLGATTYTASTPVGGTVTLLANGYTARFTPNNGFTGAARFSFTASDGTLIAGSVGVLVQMPDYRLGNVQTIGATFSATMQSYLGHTCQLQASPSLAPAAWTNVGSAQNGTGGVLTFTAAMTGAQRFYRALITQ